MAQVRAIQSQLPDLRTIIATEGGAPEWQDYTAWRDAQSADDPEVEISRQDVAIQLYTSGTTGKPKGAMLSHANLLNLVETGEGEKPDWNQWTEDDVSLVAMPIFHIGGSGWGVLGLYHGAKGVIAQGIRSHQGAGFHRALRNHKAVHGAGRDAVRGAAAARAASRFFAAEIHALWRLADSRRAVEGVHRGVRLRLRAGLRHDRDHRQHRGACRRKTMSRGWSGCARPARHCPASSSRSSTPTASRLPPGEVGEIATRSGSNMVGYWNLPEATARTLGRDGWLRTGDAGYMDKDGYLYIHDRIKDMIISGGENIYPAEVESAICDHPDVAEAAVVGVPDDTWGEAVKAIVVMKPGKQATASDIINFTRAAHRRLQDAEDGRFHRRPAAQRLRQDLAPPSARSLLGGQGPAGELRRAKSGVEAAALQRVSRLPPSLRAERSNPLLPRTGLLRRFAPRN